jgi:iron-sulfur cluster repair protein YtfE (RIC family)
MTATQRYRAQHAELFALVTQITALLEDADLSKKAAEIRCLVSSLAGKLSIHLAMEDKRLYPKLMAHSNPDVRALSKRYSEEMGSLADDFTKFNQRWLTAAFIEKDPAKFVGEINLILTALQTRIEKENNQLYKLVDNLDD